MSGTQSSNVHAVLRDRIIKCALPPDTRLGIAEIATGHGVSPGSVREALARLAAEGLVVAEEYKGYRVSPISLDELEDLTQTRIDIEALALRRALERGDLEWELAVTADFRRMDAEPVFAGDGTPSDGWAACHMRYHSALVSACGSPWLLKLRQTLFEQSERYRYLTVSVMDEAGIRTEHRRLTDAVLARDVEVVLAMLESHLARTRNSVVRLMETGKAEGLRANSDC